MTAAGLLVGALAGGGILCVTRGLWPPRRPLAAVFADAARPRWPASTTANRRHWLATVVAGVAARPGGADPADLAVIGQSRERLAVERLALAVALPTLIVATAALLAVAGSPPPPVLVALAAVPAAVAGWVVPVVVARRQAAERRAGFGEVLAAYLDLVTIQVASGAGVEQALDDAAAPAGHWAFVLFREATTVARATGTSPWSVLAATGDTHRLPELAELTSSVTLAAEDGAPVTATLAAKATALRATALADAQARAEARSEQMTLPVVLLLVGFVILIGWPSVARLTEI